MRSMTTEGSAVGSAIARGTAEEIRNAFAEYQSAFKEITRRAKARFEACDWHGHHADASERLDLYRDFVSLTVEAITAHLNADQSKRAFWTTVKQEYSRLIVGREDSDIAQSFYNSVTMRVFGVRGLDPGIQYVGSDVTALPPVAAHSVYRVYQADGSIQALLKRLLLDCNFSCGYEDLDRDLALAAGEIKGYMADACPSDRIMSVEIANAVFYRGKAAYLVGRICTDTLPLPLVIALANGEQGVWVDAVLLTEDEVSIVFSFTRSYFHAEIESCCTLVHFLKTIMPLKPVAELYISLGYNKHGKTELYRDLIRRLEGSDDSFQIARGDRGMVMTVFTLPSYDVVFKIIKDRFDYPKQTTRQEVRNRYYLVFKHDRGGRLVDAQEFENLRIPMDRFSLDLLEELLAVASKTVRVEGDEVVIDHLYTERRLAPLNLYLHEIELDTAAPIVIDYGQAIKDLAYTNIFPGDILLKNFGVTRHGRVVFYDYDELCLLTDCNFRKMPESEGMDDDLSEDPWFSVGEEDVFPEELSTFLGLPPNLREIFVQHHGELFEVGFWAGIKARIEAGEVLDISPYPERKRLRHP